MHPQENERLASLRSLQILDTAGEKAYDEITTLAAQIAGTEIALVSLVDQDRQWFKARHGLDASETPRDLAFCAHAILTPEEPFVINNATEDQRFHDNPLVAEAPSIRFYAGIPLRSPVDDMPLGTLCTISPRVLEINAQQLAQLQILANQVEHLLALRRATLDLQHVVQEVDQARQEAVEANAAKSRFIASVSHDMRTPLNGVLGTLELLADEELPANQQTMVDTAQSCGAAFVISLMIPWIYRK